MLADFAPAKPKWTSFFSVATVSGDLSQKKMLASFLHNLTWTSLVGNIMLIFPTRYSAETRTAVISRTSCIKIIVSLNLHGGEDFDDQCYRSVKASLLSN